MSIHRSLPSKASSHPAFRSSQSTKLSSLSRQAASPKFSILQVIVHVSQCHSLHLSHHLHPPEFTSPFPVCASIPALQIGSPVPFFQIPHTCTECVSHLVVPDFASPQPTRLLHPQNSPSKNIRVHSHSLFQGIFPIKGSNLHLLVGRWIFFTTELPGIK